jgi:chorismate mutase
MIVFFRKHRRSVVGVFIVGLCAILMLPFGFEYFGGPSVKRYIARIDGEEVPYRLYVDEVRRTEALYRSQFGEQYEMFAKMLNIRERVLDDIIDRTLLAALYDRLGLVVSFAQVEKYTSGLPVFQNGVDRATFEAFLKSTGLKEHEFEQKVSEQVIEDMLGGVFELAGVTHSGEKEFRFRNANAKVKIGYAQVRLPEDVKFAAVSEEDVRAYYDENSNMFLSEKKVHPVLARFPKSAFLDKVLLHEEDIEDLYNRNFSNTEKELSEVRQELEAELRGSIAPEYAKLAAEDFISNVLKVSDDKKYDELKKLSSEHGAVELREPQSPVSFGNEDSVVPAVLRSEIFQMNEFGVRMMMDGDTPVVVFMREVQMPERLNYTEVRDDIREQLESQRKNEKAKEYAQSLITEYKDAPEELRKSFLKEAAAKNGWEVKTTESAVIQNVSIPVMTNPQDSARIVSDLIKHGVYTSPYVAVSGEVYIFALDAYEVPESGSEKEINEFLVQEKQIAKNRTFQTLLTKLKSYADIEVVHELLE